MKTHRILEAGLSALTIITIVAIPQVSSAGGSVDVGIIPDEWNNCPEGSDFIQIYMDDEDDDNTSYLTGWTGATIQNQGNTGTRFGFCRVPGEDFVPHPLISYAVLMLDATCPDHSRQVFRHFDNENTDNSNTSVGNIYPSQQFSGLLANSTDMVFCHFDPGGTLPLGIDLDPVGLQVLFPDLGINYGVFAAQDGKTSFAAGKIHTDDEDNFNNNGSYYGPPSVSNPPPLDADFANVWQWLSGDEDTTLSVSMIRSSELPYGFACEMDEECVSGICYGGQVCGDPLGYGSTCTRDLECLSGICFDGQVCGDPLGYGSTCTRDLECLSGICFDGQVCGDPLGAGSTCTRDIECVNSCVFGECT